MSGVILHLQIPVLIESQHLYTDEQLTALVSQRDEAAFTVLYHRYYEMLCRSAFKRLPDEALVEELVQDVFINVWNKAAQLDADGNIKAYLFATLRNKVLHELRSRMVVARHAREMMLQNEAQKEDAHDRLDVKHLEQQFQAALQSLPPQCRQAFTLSRVEQLPYRTIADKMNISVNTVEKHIGKALSVLRKTFKEYDITLLLLILAAELIVC
jgi:RNA polymerase sigma-70 factor, ECF subfamily